jgi:hypothetical protein
VIPTNCSIAIKYGITESLMMEPVYSPHLKGRFPDTFMFTSVQRRARRENGAIAIMAAILLPVIIGLFALAIDLPRVYNRRAEMQTLADVAALAAAKKLDGTKQGVNAALAAARAVVMDSGSGPKYEYLKGIQWDNAAMTFNASPYAGTGWKSDGEALNSPAGLVFVKVDISALDQSYRNVEMFFAPIISSAFASIDVAQITIAGKGRLYVAPLAICAMSKTAQAKRVNPAGTQYDELVEYGFRRGVSYDLMQLNPDANLPISFQVDPVSLPSSASTANNFQSWIYEPYICSGTMSLPKVTGATVTVKSLFPISTYYTQLNSRFDPYTGACNVNMSPPDSNVKQYPAASVSWMTKKSLVQSAKSYIPPAPNDKSLQTVADKGPPNHPNAVDYGTLWAFSRAIPWSSVELQGTPEPTSGYTPFDATTTVWQKLYGVDSDVGTYPASTPYLATTGPSYIQSPGSARKPGTKYRRVLNVPLLSCPVSGSTAEVLAVAKFLMTVPADSASLHAEFGGIASDDRLGGPVEIYR